MRAAVLSDWKIVSINRLDVSSHFVWRISFGSTKEIGKIVIAIKIRNSTFRVHPVCSDILLIIQWF